MTCQEFENIWNDLLDLDRQDDRDESSPLFLADSDASEIREALREHARMCATCQPLMTRYETLRLAIRSWERVSKPVPPEDLPDRILVAVEKETHTGNHPNLLRKKKLLLATWAVGALAAAASIAFMMLSRPITPVSDAGKSGATIVRVEREAKADQPTPTAPRNTLALREAISEARDATWELAYAASAPALRIGRHVLEPEVEPPASLEGFDGLESSDSDDPGEIMSDVLREFGEELSSGVRPISNGARRALDFLKGVVEPTENGVKSAPARSAKGA